MIRKIALISVLFLVCACSSKEKKTKIPDNIIPPEQMVSIIVDFHLVEASIFQGQQNHEDVNLISNYRYKWIFQKHKINRNQLSESLMFYTYHMKDLEAIYKEVVVELSTTQSRIISK
jgi:hypothetical protein